MEPSIRFCASRDGTQLAYATIGAGSPLLHLPGFTTNIEFEWKDSEARAWIERVAARCLLVRCQRRGVGASQRDVGDLSLAAQVDDVAAVVGRLGAPRVAIFAAYDAAPSAIAYVVAHPERVSHLVLWAPYVRDPERGAGAYDALADLVEHNWKLFLRTWADLCFPSGPIERQRWYVDMVRQSTSPKVVIAYMKFLRDVEIGSLLPAARVPAIVFNRSGDRYGPPALGRAVAAALPDATFVPLTGDIGIPVLGDAGFLDRMFDFLGVGDRAAAEPAATTGGLRTVLFTDLVGHTEMMRRLGDERGRAVLREYERITRAVLKEHGGVEVKTMGDGFMASFASVTKAMDCAIALQRAFAAHEGEPLEVRVGLNAGEPIEEGGDLFGSTVIMAARIVTKAGAGEILVPEPLLHLLSGKHYGYTDRGETVLKGFEAPVRLYEVRWRE
jgi:class 3 adenylate cyclase/pimeloyl-ACP methyl ester carboxylesterase